MYAVKKCSRYLHGHQFLIRTDHKPLVGVENKDLESCKNIRVVRLLEDLLGYDFITEYLPGDKNHLADHLSRHPTVGEDAPYYPRLVRPSLYPSRGTVNMVKGGEVVDLTLLQLSQEALEDPEYQELMTLIVQGKHPKSLDPTRSLREYGPVFSQLSVDDSQHGPLVLLDGHRIVIPRKMRQTMLQILHQ